MLGSPHVNAVTKTKTPGNARRFVTRLVESPPLLRGARQRRGG